jgi:hypothetical protein
MANKEVDIRNNVPVISLPVLRTVIPDQSLCAGGGPDKVNASQTACEGLTGLAQQMCYAVLYNV